jgi:hypothetical protein
MGLSDMKVKSLRRHVNGRGTIRAQKIAISVTKRRKTWKTSKSKHVGNMTNASLYAGDSGREVAIA